MYICYKYEQFIGHYKHFTRKQDVFIMVHKYFQNTFILVFQIFQALKSKSKSLKMSYIKAKNTALKSSLISNVHSSE